MAKKPSANDGDLEMLAGSTEDDFIEAMTSVKEYELLYSQFSILSRFASLASKLCQAAVLVSGCTGILLTAERRIEITCNSLPCEVHVCFW